MWRNKAITWNILEPCFWYLKETDLLHLNYDPSCVWAHRPSTLTGDWDNFQTGSRTIKNGLCTILHSVSGMKGRNLNLYLKVLSCVSAMVLFSPNEMTIIMIQRSVSNSFIKLHFIYSNDQKSLVLFFSIFKWTLTFIFCFFIKIQTEKYSDNITVLLANIIGQ